MVCDRGDFRGVSPSGLSRRYFSFRLAFAGWEDILNGGPEADQFILSSGEDIIQDFTISDNDTIKSANNESIRLIQSGNDLILTTQSNSIFTALININRDDLIQSQPDLDFL